jgi:hypothetical protein
MAKLVLFLDDGATRDILLDRERITLGRRPDNDVCLPDPAVSGEHAQVVTLLADSFLEDLGSTNGTIVNGQTVQKHFLRDGDIIDLGRQRLAYFVDVDAQPSAAMRDAARRRHPEDTVMTAGTPSGPTQWDRRARTGSRGAATRSPFAEPAAAAMGADARLVHARGDSTAAGARGGLGPDAETPQLVVLTGPSAGRALPLTKEVTSVGRVGVQVAVVRRTARGYVVSAGEGSRAPLVNGASIEPGGALLVPGDILEVAGARIQFSAAPDLPT